jgi:hypothetical protein
MERSLAMTREVLGTEHIEYAESLNVYASMLSTARRHSAADRAFQEALAILRRIERPSDPDFVEGVLREILNDYASHLLRRDPAGGVAAAQQALTLLDEAITVGDPDGYGVEQVMLNRAEAQRRLGDRAAARHTLTGLVDRCQEAGRGEPSLVLLDALAQLAEVLRELGHPGHAEVLRRAYEVDAALAGPPR